MEKKFLPAFRPPRVVYGSDRTYLLIYDRTHRVKPYRPTFLLNRIKNTEERRKRAEEIKEKINSWLQEGHPFADFNERKFDKREKQKRKEKKEKKRAKKIRAKTKKHRHLKCNILDALDKARELKCNSIRPATNKSYSSQINQLAVYLEKKKLSKIYSGKFSRVMAIEYLDYAQEVRGVGNTTYNNIVTHQSAIWSALKDRGYAKKNPFQGIPPKRKEKKRRRKFSKEEAAIVLKTAYEQSRILFYSIILQHGCLIRPVELLRLRFWHVNPEEGYVLIEGENAKTYKERIMPIPEDYLIFFQEEFWTKYPKDYLIFGEKLKPHHSVPAGNSALYRRHQKILKHLKESGELKDIKGLMYYSWKDTGITDIIDQLGLIVAMDQAGHADVRSTMVYRDRPKINLKARKLKGLI